MKWKWFAIVGFVALVVGLVAGCKNEVTRPVAPKAPQQEEIPFDEGGVKGKAYSGSHDYGRAELNEVASHPGVAQLMSQLSDAGYEEQRDRSLLIEGRANGTDARVAILVSRSVQSTDEWAAVTVVVSEGVFAFDAAVYSLAPPARDRFASEVADGLWKTPIETVVGPSGAKWSGEQWDDFFVCMSAGTSGGIVKCMISCAVTGPGWLSCTTSCSGWVAMRAAVTCATGVAMKTKLGGYGKDPNQR